MINLYTNETLLSGLLMTGVALGCYWVACAYLYYFTMWTSTWFNGKLLSRLGYYGITFSWIVYFYSITYTILLLTKI